MTSTRGSFPGLYWGYAPLLPSIICCTHYKLSYPTIYFRHLFKSLCAQILIVSQDWLSWSSVFIVSMVDCDIIDRSLPSLPVIARCPFWCHFPDETGSAGSISSSCCCESEPSVINVVSFAVLFLSPNRQRQNTEVIKKDWPQPLPTLKNICIAMWAWALLFHWFMDTNVYRTGSIEIKKTHCKISMNIRIFLQCPGLIFLIHQQRLWCQYLLSLSLLYSVDCGVIWCHKVIMSRYLLMTSATCFIILSYVRH